MNDIDVVVVGASAGGLEALRVLMANLPRNFRAAVVVIRHYPQVRTTKSPSILMRVGPLPVSYPTDEEPLRPGRVYLAEPGRHITIEGGRIRIRVGPKENGQRPSIDRLFESAAQDLGPRVAGVILSGSLDDGVFGLKKIKECGGLTIVQEPSEARVPGMPENAIRDVEPHHVLPVKEIAELLARVSASPDAAPAPGAMPGHGGAGEPEPAADVPEDIDTVEASGEPTALTCPECGGAIWMVDDRPLRFRCHLGHAFSGDSFDGLQQARVENALWTAVRALRERTELFDKMEKGYDARGLTSLAKEFGERRRTAEEAAKTMLAMVLAMSGDMEPETS